MIQRSTKTLLIGAMLIGFLHASPSTSEAWTLNPFASNNKTQTKTVPVNAKKKSPSTWSKATSGTKNFFNKTGETLGLKKPQSKSAPPLAYMKPRTIQPKPRESKSSWFNWFKPAEPERPKDVYGWLGQSKQITP